MKKFVRCLVFTISLIDSARSQNSQPDRLSSQGDVLDSLTREFLLRQQGDRSAEMEFAAAQRREASFRERQFMEKIHRFVAMWDQFANEYNCKRTFNVKSARGISKAFHELENSEGWPKNK